MLDKIRTTNTLLLIIAVPLIFYLLKILSFIFIPLVFSMFIALLFLPLMRWLEKKGVNKPISIGIVIVLIAIGFYILAQLIALSGREIIATQDQFLDKATVKIKQLISSLSDFLGVQLVNEDDGGMMSSLLNKDNIVKNLSVTAGFIGRFLSTFLMTIFFTVLWLGESVNVQKLLHQTIMKNELTSIRTFLRIEGDLITFIKVKFAVSLFTGIGTGLACYFFGVSFPIFWGLFAFAINFVQMIGSFIAVICVSIFAFVELDPGTTLLFFMVSVTMVQVVFGAILEPIFMGKSFSINIISVLIMLTLWGYIWGVPGMIMSIPITVFLKILFEQFNSTKRIAKLLSGD